MAKRQHAHGRPGIAPVGLELRVEVHWCVRCGTECTVQIVQLACDPQPIAICVECGTGVDMWLPAELVEPPASGLERHVRHQGAA